jgi:hypothetical protein
MSQQTVKEAETKTCADCEQEKPLSEFHKCSKSADGRQSYCKDCKLSYQREYDRRKYRERGGYSELSEEEKRAERRYERKYKNRYPEKVKAHKFANENMSIPVELEAHHWSYRDEHMGSIFLLDEQQHYLVHQRLKYDQEEKQYRTAEGELLATKQNHRRFIADVLNEEVEGREYSVA